MDPDPHPDPDDYRFQVHQIRIQYRKIIYKNFLLLSIRTRVSDPEPDPYPDPYWIRIQSDHWIRIRLRNLKTDLDPDPGGQK